MIVVDSSAWIEYFRATESPVDRTLTKFIDAEAPLATTEIVLFEVLSGARTARELREIRAELLGLTLLTLSGVGDYERAAELYRTARRGGITPRKLNDVLIALCTIDAGASLLHADRDFDRLASVIGLYVCPLEHG